MKQLIVNIPHPRGIAGTYWDHSVFKVHQGSVRRLTEHLGNSSIVM